jgi:uncharacterized protein (TIGR02996 family)
MADLARHPQLLALLEAAHLSPHDDAPRLVLADWLEEQSDAARAEFIRLQILLAPGSALQPRRRADARQRQKELLDRFGGGWLGPLWRHGGVWYRGLLSVHLDRLRLPDGVEELRPWLDSTDFEVPGREVFRWALGLIPGLNHVTLNLRWPFPSEALLALLGAAPSCPCLRTLTVHWAPGMGRRTDQGHFVNLPEDFCARLVSLPLCRRLTHLGSLFAFTDGQAAVLRAADVEPVLARQPHWPHVLPPNAFAPHIVTPEDPE